jgi:hypothetical protein
MTTSPARGGCSGVPAAALARVAPWAAAAGVVLLAVLALPPVREAMESRMAAHMLLQFPALIAAGALLAGGCPDAVRARIARWNALGLAGLSASAAVLAVSMIPRLLDLALVDVRVEAAKWVALLLCGAALRWSWRSAGVVVQGFFLGNVLPMTAVVGVVYQEAADRLCNGYRLDEQAFVGASLVWLSIAVAVAWLAGVARASIATGPEERRGRAEA